jgi:hypothetical protein
MRQMTGYKVRSSGGLFAVYLVRADGTEIPTDQQRAVYSHHSHDRAQVISDALNNGLVSHIVQAVQVERQRRA